MTKVRRFTWEMVEMLMSQVAMALDFGIVVEN
jgi:hypothetical protein